MVDASGRPLDRLGPLASELDAPLSAPTINPLEREPIHHVLDVGVRAINALLTVGRGQRMGLFAGSGVGKSVLLGTMARYTSAEVIVIGLIGERGREVKEFIEQILGEDGLARSVVVAAPADVSPLLRMQGAAYATSLAEYFRDQGKHVLLLMDSLTRYAMAQREIRAGDRRTAGHQGLPALGVRQAAGAGGAHRQRPGRRRLDHRLLHGADRGRRPAGPDRRFGARDPGRPYRVVAPVGRGRPLSRDRHRAVDQPRHDLADRRAPSRSRAPLQADALALPAQSRPDRGGGAYAAGRDAQLDRAIALYPRIEAFLQQGFRECAPFESCLAGLDALFQYEGG